MTTKETITTFIIMIIIIVMTAIFNYEPNKNITADSKEQNEKNIEAFIEQLESEKIIYKNY